MMVNDAVKIQGVTKNYPWGNEYFISNLLGTKYKGPQAEYWMGTHPLGEATDEHGNKLSEIIGHKLDFLFKVLAINTPLAIQCHPNWEQAKEGWEIESIQRNKGSECNYKDPNQKAEAFIAITPVTALCGFLPMTEIIKNLQRYVRNAFAMIEPFLSSQKDLYFGLHNLKLYEKERILNELKANTIDSKETIFLTREAICKKVIGLYPNDIGCIFPLLMNVIHLKPMEGIFLEPDVLHAYCAGNGLEIMTASDNVLRCGLTKMRVDLKELSKIAKFEEYNLSKVEVEEKSNGSIEYIFPLNDFRFQNFNNGSYFLSIEKDSILFVMDGNAEIITTTKQCAKKGESFFIPEGLKCKLVVDGNVFIAQ